MVRMKALAVRQPYAAWLVTGEKKIEWRSWRTDYRGPLAICTPPKASHDLFRYLYKTGTAKGLTEADFPGGVALGVAELVDCIPFTPEHLTDSKLEQMPNPPGWAWIFNNSGSFSKLQAITVQTHIFDIDLADTENEAGILLNDANMIPLAGEFRNGAGTDTLDTTGEAAAERRFVPRFVAMAPEQPPLTPPQLPPVEGEQQATIFPPFSGQGIGQPQPRAPLLSGQNEATPPAPPSVRKRANRATPPPLVNENAEADKPQAPLLSRQNEAAPSAPLSVRKRANRATPPPLVNENAEAEKPQAPLLSRQNEAAPSAPLSVRKRANRATPPPLVNENAEVEKPQAPLLSGQVAPTPPAPSSILDRAKAVIPFLNAAGEEDKPLPPSPAKRDAVPPLPRIRNETKITPPRPVLNGDPEEKKPYASQLAGQDAPTPPPLPSAHAHAEKPPMEPAQAARQESMDKHAGEAIVPRIPKQQHPLPEEHGAPVKLQKRVPRFKDETDEPSVPKSQPSSQPSENGLKLRRRVHRFKEDEPETTDMTIEKRHGAHFEPTAKPEGDSLFEKRRDAHFEPTGRQEDDEHIEKRRETPFKPPVKPEDEAGLEDSHKTGFETIAISEPALDALLKKHGKTWFDVVKKTDVVDDKP